LTGVFLLRGWYVEQKTIDTTTMSALGMNAVRTIGSIRSFDCAQDDTCG